MESCFGLVKPHQHGIAVAGIYCRPVLHVHLLPKWVLPNGFAMLMRPNKTDLKQLSMLATSQLFCKSAVSRVLYSKSFCIDISTKEPPVSGLDEQTTRRSPKNCRVFCARVTRRPRNFLSQAGGLPSPLCQMQNSFQDGGETRINSNMALKSTSHQEIKNIFKDDRFSSQLEKTMKKYDLNFKVFNDGPLNNKTKSSPFRMHGGRFVLV